MKLKLLSIKSGCLNPPESGCPEDWENFDVLMEIELCFVSHEVDSVYFEFYVASPSALALRPTNSFMPPTLELNEFNWKAIKNHVTKLLSHVSNCKSWTEVAVKLNGTVRISSMSCFPW